MAISKIQPNFSGGEISPELFGRVDMAKYSSGCSTLRNFLVAYRGGAMTRPGTKFVARSRQGSPVIPSIPAAPFWRIRWTGLQTWAGTITGAQIANVQFRATAGGPSVATGGTAIASSVLDPNYVAANAFDGDPATFWNSSIGDTIGAWVGYQFPSAVVIREVALQSGIPSLRGDVSNPSNPKSFAVDYSLDGAAWTQIYAADNNFFWQYYNSGATPVAAEPRVFTFGVTPQFFRLNITANTGAGHAEINVRRFALYDANGVDHAALGGGAPNADAWDFVSWIDYPNSPFSYNNVAWQNGAFWVVGFNSGQPGFPHTLDYGFFHPVPTIKSYGISWSSFLPGSAPSAWQFQISNDYVNWTTVDTQTGIGGWVDNVLKTFTIP